MKQTSNWVRIISKLTSARFLIVVILTIVFSICTIKQTITTEFLSVYMCIIGFYFGKERESK